MLIVETRLSYWIICFWIISPASFSLLERPNSWIMFSISSFSLSVCNNTFSTHSFSFLLYSYSFYFSPIYFLLEIASLLSFCILVFTWALSFSFYCNKLLILLNAARGLLVDLFDMDFSWLSSSESLYAFILIWFLLKWTVYSLEVISRSLCLRCLFFIVSSKTLSF